MGISLHTALVLSSHPDSNSPTINGIYIEASQDGNKWFSTSTLIKNNRPHMLLLSTKPMFDDKDSAIDFMKRIVSQARETVENLEK